MRTRPLRGTTYDPIGPAGPRAGGQASNRRQAGLGRGEARATIVAVVASGWFAPARLRDEALRDPQACRLGRHLSEPSCGLTGRTRRSTRSKAGRNAASQSVQRQDEKYRSPEGHVPAASALGGVPIEVRARCLVEPGGIEPPTS